MLSVHTLTDCLLNLCTRRLIFLWRKMDYLYRCEIRKKAIDILLDNGMTIDEIAIALKMEPRP